MIDLTAEEEDMNIKNKIVVKTMDLSPIVCRTNSVEKHDDDDEYICAR